MGVSALRPCLLTFTAVPKKPEARGRPGVRPIGTIAGDPRWGDSVDSIREKLRSKARKYGEPPVPFVIAVNVLDVTCEAEDELRQALFGHQHAVVNAQGECRIVHMSNGLWLKKDGPHYPNVSGVLLVEGATPWTIRVVESCFYPNPWASIPLSQSLQRFRKVMVQDGAVIRTPGEAIGEILELPDNWPGARSADR
jgi:hypothetical protein